MPVAQQQIWILFGLRDKVGTELDYLLKADVIKKTQAPMPCISAVVVVPKKKGQIRLFLDMRCANEAVICERHPLLKWWKKSVIAITSVD